MSFRESENWPMKDMMLFCERTIGGAYYNVHTSHMGTYFGSPDLPRKQYGYKFLDMLISLIFNPKLDIQGLRTERAAINCERSLNETDQPESMATYWLYQLIYRNNPIRKFTTCDPKDLKKITLNELREYRSKHYVSENMFAVTSSQYAGKARLILAKLPDHKKPPRFVYDPRDCIPTLTETKEKIHIMSHLELHHRQLGFPVANHNHPDSAGLEILKRILAYRLHFRLREENQNIDKGCYHTYVDNETSKVHGLFSIGYATKSKEFSDTAEERILEELNKLASDLVEKEVFNTMVDSELDSYKKMFIWHPLTVVDKIVFATCNGDKDLKGLHGYGDALQTLTRNKIRDLSNKYLTKGYARAIVRAK